MSILQKESVRTTIGFNKSGLVLCISGVARGLLTGVHHMPEGVYTSRHQHFDVKSLITLNKSKSYPNKFNFVSKISVLQSILQKLNASRGLWMPHYMPKGVLLPTYHYCPPCTNDYVQPISTKAGSPKHFYRSPFTFYQECVKNRMCGLIRSILIKV